MPPMTSAERQRKYRQKLKEENPEELQKLKKDNAERTKKNYITIKQLPDNLRKVRRQQWRKQKQKKEDEPKTERKIRKEKRKVRLYLLSKENLVLNARVEKMIKIIKAQRKTLYRYKKKMADLQESLERLEKENKKIRNLNNKIENKDALTPISKTRIFLHETVPNIPSLDIEKVKKVILEGYVFSESLSNQYSKAKSNSEKAVLKNVVNNNIVTKYKLKTKFSNSCLGLKGKLRQRQRTLQNKKMRSMKEVQNFLERDDNSRITAGKRETKTHKKNKKQVRYLLDSLEKLHKKYKDEGGLVSYTTFTRYKPFHIMDPKLTQRNTCACVKHSNISLVAQKLKVLGVLETDDLDKLVSDIVCDKLNEKCMYNECKSCENKTISFDFIQKNRDLVVSWNAWVTKTHEYTKCNNNQENEKKITKRTIKDVIQGTLGTLIKSFSDQLLKFKKHYFNVYHAYQMNKKCKETLPEIECIIHCDFSENYLCKCHEEVQATHFGASQQQFTLHTGVLYYKNEECLQEKSFCTISPINNHGPIAIWAHLTPILEYIKTSLPKVTTLNFFSDGPTTQYRQKGNFYLMSEMIKKLGFQKSTWSFFESAHGKGAADGIGGAVKRILDKKVTYGEDIVDAQTAYDILEKCHSKIMFFYISHEKLKTVEQEVDLSGLIPVPHTMDIHQVITTDQVPIIKFRKLACFCRDPLCKCFGLQEHNLKLKKLKRKYDEVEITKKTIKRRRIPKSRKRSAKANNSDTSIDSDITYADSDDSVWNVNHEYDEFDNKYGNDENINNNNIDIGLKENHDVNNKTVKSNNKKVTLLSDVRNTPQNCRYFDLKNYGPLTLHKVDKIDICKPITSSVKYKSKEMELSKEIKLRIGIREKFVLKEKEIVLEKRNNMVMVTNIDEKSDSEQLSSTKSGLKEKCNNEEINTGTGIELRGDNAKHDDTMGEMKIVLGEENTVLKENDIDKRSNSGAVYDNATKSDLKEKNNGDEMKTSTETELRGNVTKENLVEEIILVDEKVDFKREHKSVIENIDYSKTENEAEEPTAVIKKMANATYNINDSVLVRYYEKKSWIYYIGFIEDVEIKTDLIYYTITFLKTLKKQQLQFKTPKRIDKDTSPLNV